MKKILALSVIAAGVFFTACNNEAGGLSATAKKNMAANDSIMKAYERGDFSKMGDYIAADAVDHGGEQGDIVGLDNIVKEMKRYKEMMPDMKIVMMKTTADDEYVYTWSEVKGTMMGKEMTMKSVDVTRFKDGKAAEHWVYMDPKDIMAMMPPMPADTTSMQK